MDTIFIFLFILLTIALVGGGLMISHLVCPPNPSKLKNQTYECGEKTVGSSWIRFNVGYYLFALLFLVFDVEAVFLFPWAVVFKKVGFVGLIEAALFVFVLIVGLFYAWRKNVLEWE